MADPKVIVALDTGDANEALAFAGKVTPELCKLKVGKELFTSAGPAMVENLVNQGFDIFLDLKFHDIPNTVKKAVYAASRLGVWMTNVHALGGQSMLQAAREALEMASSHRPLLIAVTVLTSLSDSDLKQLGLECSVEAQVGRLADLALESGLDGLVCSALEVGMLRRKFQSAPLLVTPGIRPAGADMDDQQRVMTPQQAMIEGASYLVIGRPLTQNPEPAETLVAINQSLAEIGSPAI